MVTNLIVDEGLKGDFIGFTFNGVHSSTLGITRVSNSDRYNDDVFGQFTDKTVENANGDGTYYFGSNFNKKEKVIDIAYDSMTEVQKLKLSVLFSDSKIHELIFDEEPYKKYYAKVSVAPSLTFLCFDDEKDKRIYKGEGEIDFIFYNPFGYSVHKFLDEYSVDSSQWAGASRMEWTQGLYDKMNTEGYFPLYNAGDKETPFTLDIPFKNNKISEMYFYIGTEKGEPLVSYALSLDEMTALDNDVAIRIDTKLQLIYGLIEENGEYVKTSNLYNEYIKEGYLFTIPKSTEYDNLVMVFSEDFLLDYSDFSVFDLKYSYLYY